MLQKNENRLFGRILVASVVLMVVSLFSPSFFDYPLWLGGIFVLSFIWGAIYIYVCYHKIITNTINALIEPEQICVDEFTELEEIDDIIEVESTPVVLSNEVKTNIERNIQQWLKKKEFTHPNISINHVAKSTYTNRTYLSRYINSVYKCSFRVWITRLRIEEAKELIETRPELSISEVATLTGFASTESFSHIFARYEQTSPSRWRTMATIEAEERI